MSLTDPESEPSVIAATKVFLTTVVVVDIGQLTANVTETSPNQTSAIRNVGANLAALSNITRFYLQNKKRIDLPTLYVLKPTDGQHMGGDVHPTLTSQFCSDIYDCWNGNHLRHRWHLFFYF